MFDKSAVDEYRSLTAPSMLKERVLRVANKQKRPSARLLPTIGALAACIVLFFAATWLDVQDDVMISSGWELSSAASLALPVNTASRANAAYCASFTVTTRDALEFDTDDTLFVVTDEGALIADFPYTTSDVVTINWYVTAPKAHMTVNGVSYTLIADENNGTFQIVQD